MLTLNPILAEAIANQVNMDSDDVTIDALEVRALADGSDRFTRLSDFYDLCMYYAEVSREVKDPITIRVIAGIAYCVFCDDQVDSDQCICTMYR